MIDSVIGLYSRELVKKGKKNIPEEIVMIELCERFHWTEEEYLNTSRSFIDLILEKDRIDYKINKLKNGS